MPLFSVIFGGMTDAFSGNDSDAILSAAGTCAMYKIIYILDGSSFWVQDPFAFLFSASLHSKFQGKNNVSE